MVFANPFRSVVPSSVRQLVVTVWDTTQTDSDQKSTFLCAAWPSARAKGIRDVEAESEVSDRQVRAQDSQP